MTKIGWYSTDWAFDPILDKVASAMSGRQTFVQGKKHAIFGGTYYYRMAMPAVTLGKHGYDTVLSPSFDVAPDGHIVIHGVDGVAHDDCDVVVFQRWMHRDGAEMARRARATGQLIVQDIDDYFWALPHTNTARKNTSAATNSEHNRDHYRKMMAASDAIICSTDMLASAMSKLGPPVFVARNAIELDVWRQHDPGTDGMVGWVGGIPWRGNDLPLLRGVLGPFLEQNGLPFYHGGHSSDPKVPTAWEQLGLDTTKVRVAYNDLSPVATYPLLWDPVALAVIPLEDCSFNRAKSWLKGLEAAACGIPFIATRLPEYELLGIGRLARNRKEWRTHLEALLDPEVRRAEGAANRRRAEELSIDKQWGQWDHIFTELTAKELACTAA